MYKLAYTVDVLFILHLLLNLYLILIIFSKHKKMSFALLSDSCIIFTIGLKMVLIYLLNKDHRSHKEH